MKSTVSVLEFRRLLHEIKDRRGEVCVRYRLIGKMWEPFFLTVVALTENGATFVDPGKETSSSVDDLSKIIQFEFDKSFMGYQPLFHYELTITEPFVNESGATSLSV